MKAATLFSGIGAPEVAMPGWTWLWHAEIEKFPCAVMKARHPGSVNLGDVNAEDFVERALAVGRPDVVVWGAPCTDFSVAGKRVGLDGARGNLALVGLGIIGRLRPTWFVFENVPGLLSSYSGGAEAERAVREGPVGGSRECDEDSDFATFLSAVRECGYLGCCYRILDAQFAGVAQRRRRIFLVGHASDWRATSAILLNRESLCWNPAPSREAGERAAGTVSASLARCSADEAERGTITAASTSGDGYWREGIGALRGRAQDSHENLIAGTLNANAKAAGSATQQDAENNLLIAGTLDAAGGKSRGAGTPPGMVVPILESGARAGREGHEGRDGLGLGEPGDPMFALQAKQRHAIAFGGNNTSGSIDAATAVRAKGGTGHGDFESETFVVADPITASYQKHGGASAGKDSTPRNLVVQTRGSNVGVEDDQTGTLGSNADRASGSAPMVLAFDPRQIAHPANHSNPKPGDPCHPLRGVANAEPAIIAFDTTQITHPENGSKPDDRSPQLSHGGHPPAIAFDCKAGGHTSFAINEELAGALRVGGDSGGAAAVFKPSHYTRGKDSGPSDVMAPLTADADKGNQDPVLFTGAAVRRLTPVECARLQAFPDDYLDIKFRGKPAADGPKYRALGNSMCVAEIRWILWRIEMFEGLKK
jgi:DNA (cytosine-5)-methyltransferase 1